MASIRKRGNKYQVQVRRANSSPIAKTFHKRSDALEWARVMEVKADRHDLPVSIKILQQQKVSDVVKRYRDQVSIKKKSYNSEVFILNAFLRTKLSKITLSQISTTDFYDYREQRLKKVKAGTVNRELGIIQHAFDMAMNEWGIPIKENPLNKLRKLKVNNTRNRRLKKGELEIIKEAALQTRNPYVLPIILFAVETGMRRGEILSITKQDVNFESRTLCIPITKNGHSRTIPLTGKAIEILEVSLKNNEEMPFPITCNSLRLAWGRLITRAGIKDLHFHDLRREAVSRFFERGLSVPEVALISGHKDFRMLSRYVKLHPEDVAKKL